MNSVHIVNKAFGAYFLTRVFMQECENWVEDFYGHEMG